jgi:hypothetical protein
MKTLKIFLFYIILLNFVYSQTNWDKNVITNTSGEIVSLDFINPNTGWIVTNTQLLKTTDKGVSFTLQKSFNFRTRPDVDFLNNNIGFLYEGNTIWKTTNGGNTWSSYSISVASNINAIRFANENTGYISICGNNWEVFKTTDGGNSWSPTCISNVYPGHTPLVYDINIGYDVNGNYDPNKVWFCGVKNILESILRKTTDGLISDHPYNEASDIFSHVAVIPGMDFTQGVRVLGGNGIYNVPSSPNLLFQFGINPTSQLGLSYPNQNNGYAATRDGNVWKTTNQGYNWSIEYTFQTNSSYMSVGSKMNFFNDIGYFGYKDLTSGTYGALYTRTLGTNMNVYEDNVSVAGTIQFDGENKSITSGGLFQYLRGGKSYLYIDPQSAQTNKLFYKWNDGSMRYNRNYDPYTDRSFYFDSPCDISAYFKTKFESVTATAINNASQTKAIKDTISVLNGIVHTIHESMGGIFYSRSTDGGTSFSKEEIVNFNSNTYDANGNKNSHLNVLRYYGSLNPLTQTNSNNNVIATWERYNPSTQKTEICISRRYVDLLNMPAWTRYMDYQNEPIFKSFSATQDFNSYPKIFAIANYIDEDVFHTTIYLPHLEPYNTNQKKLVISASAFHGGSFLRQEFELDNGNISDVSVTAIKTTFGGYVFYFAYVKDNNIVYRKERFLYEDGLEFYRDPNYEVDNTFTNNDGQTSRISPDISLKNGYPVIAYRGNHTRNWAMQYETGSNEDNWVTVGLYPVIVYYKNSNNNDWTKIMYESDGQHINEYPNVEGSKDADAYIVNFKSAPSVYSQFAKVFGIPYNNYHCAPPKYSATDAKLVRGCYTGVNGASSYPMLLTLNQNGQLYDVGEHPFEITEATSSGNGSDGFDNMNGVININNTDYIFNLGPIFVRNTIYGFEDDVPPSSVESAVEFNSNMVSDNFSLSNNDTLIIGAFGSHQTASEDGFRQIKFHVELINKSTGASLRVLFGDTVRYEDSVETEYLRGYVITGIQNGTDSFYVQLFVDTVDAEDGEYDMSGVYVPDPPQEGDGPLHFKKRVHFENDNSGKPTNIIPKEYSLSQNYPNPFNPVTNIKYQIPKDGLVTLKVYDITGREIANLVKEYKQAGYYTVSFNGSNFASSVYFYRIQSGDFMQVKKMVLIK